MTTVSVAEIKTRLSYYLDLVESGKTFTICRRNVPIAIIKPITAVKEKKLPQVKPEESRISSIKKF